MHQTQIEARPVVSLNSQATVQQASELLKKEQVGAIVVVDRGKLVGIVSERDIVRRVVACERNPKTTLLSEVMTSPVRTVTVNRTIDDALAMTREDRIRHLPVVDRAGKVLGVLSVPDLLREKSDALDVENAGLLAFICVDGMGGD
jgi:CBS domain-containing protein